MRKTLIVGLCTASLATLVGVYLGNRAPEQPLKRGHPQRISFNTLGDLVDLDENGTVDLQTDKPLSYHVAWIAPGMVASAQKQGYIFDERTLIMSENMREAATSLFHAMNDYLFAEIFLKFQNTPYLLQKVDDKPATPSQHK